MDTPHTMPDSHSAQRALPSRQDATPAAHSPGAALEGILDARRESHIAAGLRVQQPATNPGTAFSVQELPGGLAVSGELDIATCPQLHAAFSGLALRSDGAFVLDLHGLTFLGMVGVRLLADIHAVAASAGPSPRITPPVSAAVRRMLRTAVAYGWLPPSFVETTIGTAESQP